MRLFFLLYSIIGTSLAGVGIVVVLALGMTGWEPIVAAAAVGAAVAIVATWLAANRISSL